MNIKKRAGICPQCHKRNHVLAPDIAGDVCDDCMDNLLEKSSLIICNNCHSLAGFAQHGNTDSGFEFEKGKTYTTDFCKRCDDKIGKLEINELNKYLSEKGIAKDTFLR